MESNSSMPNMGNEIPTNAISLYGQDDAIEDFPVLKAFQQYVDAEQEKARKRLVSMGIIFGVLMLVVISVFVVLLISVTMRNQALNDRMIEYAMRDRENRGSAVVVQSTPQHNDNAAVLSLTAKLEEMQKQMLENQAKSERAVAEAEAKARQAAIDAMKPKPPSPQELEIERLKTLLEVEKQQAASKLEMEKKRQDDIEAYRRKHYPELYEPVKPVVQSAQRVERRLSRRQSVDDIIDDIDKVIDKMDDEKAITYFEDDEADEHVEEKKKVKAETKPAAPKLVEAPKPTPAPQDKKSAPLSSTGSNGGWRIPTE